MKPADALTRRHEFAHRLNHSDPVDGPGHLLRDIDGHTACFCYDTKAPYGIWFAQTLPRAEVFYVAPDPAQLVKHAAQSWPGQALLATDPPTRSGFIVWDRASPNGASVQLAWTVRDNPAALWVAPDVSEQTMFGECQSNSPMLPIGIPFDEEIAEIDASRNWYAWMQRRIMTELLATWTLMQQTIMVSERRPGNRAEQRRAARTASTSDVVVLRLRRVVRHDDDAEGGGHVDYSHRWLVNGHWRNQWLPSAGAHRLQWINPYVKGPEDKPLVLKRHMTGLVR